MPSFFLKIYMEVDEISFAEHRINKAIRVSEVRLIDENGVSMGVLSTSEAKKLAEDRGLDLVEMSPNARPPVCKMMDYGKYKYEQTKKDKEAKKKQHVIVVKEVQIRPNIDKHDLKIKLDRSRAFLEKGFKVKFVIRFRGRELEYRREKGSAMFDVVIKELSDVGDLESSPSNEERTLVFYMAPRKEKTK
ncbi:MAG: translation initiation factor IF-3 [Candidatus Goldiibacteriota bacterium]